MPGKTHIMFAYFMFMLYTLQSTKSHAQHSVVDSLNQILKSAKHDTDRITILLKQAGKSRRVGQMEEGLNCIKRAAKIAESISNERKTAECDLEFARMYQYMDELTLSLTHAQNAFNFFKQTTDSIFIGRAHIALSEAYSVQGNYAMSMTNLYTGLEIFEKRNLYPEIALTGAYLGQHYLTMADSSQAYDWFMKSAEAMTKYDAPAYLLAANDMQLGWLLFYKKQYRQSIVHALRAHELFRKENNIVGKMYTLCDLAENYDALFDTARNHLLPSESRRMLDTALLYVNRAFELSTQANNQTFKGYSLTILGRIYFKQNKIEQAKSTLFTATKILKKIMLYVNLEDCYRTLYEIESQAKSFRKAYEYYKLSIQYKDSTFTQENLKRSEGLKIKYQVERKEEQIKLLATGNLLKNTLAIKQNQQRNFAFAGIGVFLLAGVAGSYNYQRRRKAQLREALTNERLRINNELNDEVGATLSGLAMYCHLASDQIKVNNLDMAFKSLHTIQTSSSKMVTKLSDFVWILNPAHDGLLNITKRLEDLLTDLSAKSGIKYSISIDENAKKSELPIDLRTNLYQLAKELSLAAIADHPNSTIRIGFKKLSGIIDLRFSHVNPSHESFLTKDLPELISTRLKQMGAEINVHSINDETTMHIKMTSVKKNHS